MTTHTIPTTFTVDGFTEAVTGCDRCGKMGLKGTYHITTQDDREYYLGSACVRRAADLTAKEAKRKIAEDTRRMANFAETTWINSPARTALKDLYRSTGLSYTAMLVSPEYRQELTARIDRAAATRAIIYRDHFAKDPGVNFKHPNGF